MKFSILKYSAKNSNFYINKKVRRYVVSKLIELFLNNYTIIWIDEFGIGSKIIRKKGWISTENIFRRTKPSMTNNLSVIVAMS